MPLLNYVKFFRGTPEAYNNLIDKDKDALYFISQPEEGISKLYLGDKLISGVGNTSDDMYSLIQELQSAVGQKNLEEPSTGLYGEVESINNNLETCYLKTSDAENLINTKIAQVDHLKRKVVLELPKENIDTNTIYMVLKQESQDTSDKYDEYIYSEATSGLEKVGNWNVDLTNYATKSEVENLQSVTAKDLSEIKTNLTGLNAQMQNLSKTYVPLTSFKETIGDINTLTNKKSNLVEAINYLDKVVTWGTIT